MAVWLLFDWCWYPQPVPVSTPRADRLVRLQRLLLEAGIADRVRPWPFVGLSVGLALVAGVATFELLGIVVFGLAGAAAAGLLPLALCVWLRARRRAQIQDSVGDVLAFLQSGIEQG